MSDTPIEWLQAKQRIDKAQAIFSDLNTPTRILYISGSSRDEDTCPQEKSKTEIFLEVSAKRLKTDFPSIEIDFLDLGDMTAGKAPMIFPCKGCYSTAAPLCNWPCSCYPNPDLKQSPDWMDEIYVRLARAHGVIVGTPVKWYKPDSVLCLLLDRLVCADGGNPDPDITGFKNKEACKELERSGKYPIVKHLGGRSVGFFVHGDYGGQSTVLNSLVLTFSAMGFEIAGPTSVSEYMIAPESGYYADNLKVLADSKAMENIQERVHRMAVAVLKKAVLLRTGYKMIQQSDFDK